MHNPLTREFERKLVRLETLAELVEESLAARAAELDARLSAEAESYPEDQRHDFFEYHAEDYFELADELPTLIRYSVLTGADSALEVYLNNTCEAYAEVNGATVTLKDLRGTGIARAREYLRKVARMPFPDLGSQWILVERLHKLRNAIVHEDGYVPPSRTDVRQWCKSIPGLRITGSGVISFSRDFVPSAVAAYQEFATQVDDACVDLSLWQWFFPPVDGV